MEQLELTHDAEREDTRERGPLWLAMYEEGGARGDKENERGEGREEIARAMGALAYGAGAVN